MLALIIFKCEDGNDILGWRVKTSLRGWLKWIKYWIILLFYPYLKPYSDILIDGFRPQATI